MCTCICVCVYGCITESLAARQRWGQYCKSTTLKWRRTRGGQPTPHSISLRAGVCGWTSLWELLLLHPICFCMLCFHFHLSQGIFSFLFLFLLWPMGCFPFCCFVQLLRHAWVFATPWTGAGQAPLSSTTSRSLLQFMSIEAVILLNLHRLVNFPVFSV